jgi:hypothetical protein
MSFRVFSLSDIYISNKMKIALEYQYSYSFRCATVVVHDIDRWFWFGYIGRIGIIGHNIISTYEMQYIILVLLC